MTLDSTLRQLLFIGAAFVLLMGVATTVSAHDGIDHSADSDEKHAQTILDFGTVEEKTDLLHRALVELVGRLQEVVAIEEAHDHSSHEHSEAAEASHAGMDLSGIHIMGDGSVMLGDGTVLSDATVNDEDMIVLADGTVVESTLDMRTNEAAMTEHADHH